MFTNPNLAPKHTPHGYDKKQGTIYLPFLTVKQAIQPVRQNCAQYFAPERLSGLLPELGRIYIDQSSSSSGLVGILDPPLTDWRRPRLQRDDAGDPEAVLGPQHTKGSSRGGELADKLICFVNDFVIVDTSIFE
ncbi:hypothetical protein FPRO05_11419 [Fusarium proliferatum]|uniref:Uncharacterized protein n=1 Tax=Gibberella intermedia TaxID=948311 RepID=A0A365NA61_GIBIN|nr:hypothetical protein FPRO05_11419 [Fusarium proliferatum]